MVLDLCSVVLWGCPDYVSATARALIQRSLVNTRSLHLHSIRQGSITAQWGNDDSTESFCVCVGVQLCVEVSSMLSVSSKHWLVPSVKKLLLILCQVTDETLDSAGALRLPTHMHSHAEEHTCPLTFNTICSTVWYLWWVGGMTVYKVADKTRALQYINSWTY